MCSCDSLGLLTLRHLIPFHNRFVNSFPIVTSYFINGLIYLALSFLHLLSSSLLVFVFLTIRYCYEINS